MKKFDGILMCTDLDGTLYKKDKTVSKENKEAIEYFKQNGGKFTFITGRPPTISSDAYSIINPNAPFGCNNGGGVYDGVNKNYLWVQALSDDSRVLIDYIENEMDDMGIQINTESGIYFHKDNIAMEYFRKVTGCENILKRHEQISEPILKIIFATTDEEKILKLASLLTSHPKAKEFDFIRSERILYEIVPKGIDKGTALKKIAELTNSHTTIAVGDYDNDIGMLKAADISYAVKNASENAKKAADRITVSNEESAIAAIINNL